MASPATISEASISTLLRCARLWRYRYVDRLEPVVSAPALLMGRAFAHGLEKADPNAASDQIREDAEAARKRALGDAWARPCNPDLIKVQATTVEAAVAAYIQRFGTAEEREVEHRIAHGGHTLICRIDAIGGVDDGDGYIVEDKFVARQIPPREVEILRQLTIESYVHWCSTGKFAHIHYRQIRKPAIRQRRDESVDGLCERIRVEYQREDFITEAITRRTSEDHSELIAELSCWRRQMTAITEAPRNGTRNTDACLRYGQCEFLPLCLGEPGAKHQFCKRENRKATNEPTNKTTITSVPKN